MERKNMYDLTETLYSLSVTYQVLEVFAIRAIPEHEKQMICS